MYQFTLYAHSWLRWVVLILAFAVVIRSLIGLFGNPHPYKKADNLLAAAYAGSLHVQLLLGLILYFALSPHTDFAMKDMASAMRDSVLRFWAVEHTLLMILAVIFGQLGRSISKKAQDNEVKFRFQALFFSASLLMILIGVPWSETARLFRF